MGLELTPVLICDGPECTSRHVGQTLRHFNVPHQGSLLGGLLDSWSRFGLLQVMLGIYWREVKVAEGWIAVRQGVRRRDHFYCPGCQARRRLPPVPSGLPGS